MNPSSVNASRSDTVSRHKHVHSQVHSVHNVTATVEVRPDFTSALAVLSGRRGCSVCRAPSVTSATAVFVTEMKV